MIKIGEFCIEEYPKENKLVITLPQTLNSVRTTSRDICERKEQLESEELINILSFVMYVYLPYRI